MFVANEDVGKLHSVVCRLPEVYVLCWQEVLMDSYEAKICGTTIGEKQQTKAA